MTTYNKKCHSLFFGYLKRLFHTKYKIFYHNIFIICNFILLEFSYSIVSKCKEIFALYKKKMYIYNCFITKTNKDLKATEKRYLSNKGRKG